MAKDQRTSFKDDNKQYEAWLRQQCDVIEPDLRKKRKKMRKNAFTFLRATYFRWAATIDSRPAGPMRLAAVLSTCMCGPAFDLDATPNFKARMAESGLEWPPPTLFKVGALAGKAAQ